MWARVKGRTEGGGSPREQPGGSGGEARGINKWFQDPPEFPPPALPGVQGLGVYLYPGGARYEGEMYRGRCSGSGVYYFRITEDPSKGTCLHFPMIVLSVLFVSKFRPVLGSLRCLRLWVLHLLQRYSEQ